MSKKVVLVGHCGADSSYLRLAVKAADQGVQISSAESTAELQQALDAGVDLVLFNRQVDYGFETYEGVDIIRQFRATHPNAKMMLVSNYPEAQQAAVAAGAMPGFGKRELGSPKVKELLQKAMALETAV